MDLLKMYDATQDRQKCASSYINNNGPSTTTVLCTILIVFFTVVLEFAAHSYMNCCNTIKDEDVYAALGKTPDEEELLPLVVVKQPQLEAAPRPDVPRDDEPETDTAETHSEEAQKKPPPLPDCCTCCVPNPSPNIRANRFVAAIFLYTVVLTAFSIRMDNIVHPYISLHCRTYFTSYDVAEPNWWAVCLLNILPFVIATLGFLRTVVDCLLVRWGRNLKYVGQDGEDDWTTWPMCMSCFLVFVCIREAARLPITLLMGIPRSAAGARHNGRTQMAEHIQICDPEMRGLADGIEEDNACKGDQGGPPAYNDAVHDQENIRTGPGKGK